MSYFASKRAQTSRPVTFSSDLKFKCHVNETLLKFNKALSPLYKIASYIPRKVLSQVYDVYVKPHLEYCSAVYDGNLTMFDRQRLEKAKNRAARLITGVPRRTSVNGLRKELGWSSVNDQRQTSRLLLLHKLMYDDTVPEYIKASVPNTRGSDTRRLLRGTQDNTLTQPVSRTNAYYHSFIPRTVKAWNELPQDCRLPCSYIEFKRKINNLNGPVAPNSYFSHGSKKGNTLHTRLRLQASSLNAHKVPIGLANSARCACGSEREDTSHYFLRCPLHCQARCDLFRALSHLLRQDFASLPALTQTKLLINGPQDKDVAMQVALAVQNFLFKTQRFH